MAAPGPPASRTCRELLEDTEFITAVKQECALASRRSEMYDGVISPGLLVEMLLSNIRVISIRRGKVLARECRMEERSILERVNEFEKDLAGLTEEEMTLYEEYRQKLDDIKSKRAKQAIILSGAKWVEEGEKATKYFLSRGKQLSAKKSINKIQSDGQVIIDN